MTSQSFVTHPTYFPTHRAFSHILGSTHICICTVYAVWRSLEAPSFCVGGGPPPLKGEMMVWPYVGVSFISQGSARLLDLRHLLNNRFHTDNQQISVMIYQYCFIILLHSYFVLLSYTVYTYIICIIFILFLACTFSPRLQDQLFDPKPP